MSTTDSYARRVSCGECVGGECVGGECVGGECVGGECVGEIDPLS